MPRYKVTRFKALNPNSTEGVLLNGWQAEILEEEITHCANIMDAYEWGWDRWAPHVHYGKRSVKWNAGALRDDTFITVSPMPPANRIEHLEITQREGVRAR